MPKQPHESGAVSLDAIQYETPKGKWSYDWDGIKDAISQKKAYVLPLDAKRNSIETGLKREGINGRIGTLKDSEQMVIVPKSK